jgi:hypothetical protein
MAGITTPKHIRRAMAEEYLKHNCDNSKIPNIAEKFKTNSAVVRGCLVIEAVYRKGVYSV